MFDEIASFSALHAAALRAARGRRSKPGAAAFPTLTVDMRRWRPGLARTGSGAASRWGFVPVALISVVAALFAAFPLQATAGDSNARLFAAHALALRSAGAAGEERAAGVLAALPGAGVREADTLTALWQPFFENAIVKLGRLNTTAPVSLYYNPLLDIAVVAFWEKREGRHFVSTVRALPGERLGDPDAAVSEQPAWMGAEDPVEALGKITAARLNAFRRAHPADGRSGARDSATFAAAAEDMRAALPRLVWLLAARAQWMLDGNSWLEQTLADIDAALRERDAAGLSAAAAETDASTVDALARLPEEFAYRLVLDTVLPLPDRDRLVIASLPDDGDVYLLATCRLQGGNCALRRFMLVSLSAQ